MIKPGSEVTLLDTASTGLTVTLTNLIDPVNAIIGKLDALLFGHTATPEPLTLLLLGSGLAAIGTWARKRRRNGSR